MMMFCVPSAFGWLVLLQANSFSFLCLGVFLTGFSGAFSMLAPAFLREVAEVEIRGRLASVGQVMYTLGVFSTYVMGASLPWRDVTKLCLPIPWLALVFLYFLPESPALLVQQGRLKEARKALTFYRGQGREDVVGVEMAKLQAKVQKDEGASLGLAAILASKQHRIPLLISMFFMLLQQLTGVKVVNKYVVKIFEKSGSTLDPYVCSIVVGATNVVGTLLAAKVIDSFGRKNLLITSSFSVFISYSMLGTFFLLITPAIGHLLPTWLPFASLILFALSCSSGSSVPWILNSELPARQAKATSSSMGAAANWLTSFLVVKFTPTMEATVGAGPTYLALGLINLAIALMVYKWCPETRGLTEEQVEDLWRKPESTPVNPIVVSE